jgi:hypothetical protein
MLAALLFLKVIRRECMAEEHLLKDAFFVSNARIILFLWTLKFLFFQIQKHVQTCFSGAEE